MGCLETIWLHIPVLLILKCTVAYRAKTWLQSFTGDIQHIHILACDALPIRVQLWCILLEHKAAAAPEAFIGDNFCARGVFPNGKPPISLQPQILLLACEFCVYLKLNVIKGERITGENAFLTQIFNQRSF